MVKRIVMALVGVAALASPVAVDAKPRPAGSENASAKRTAKYAPCRNAKRVGFVVAGSLAALDETSVTVRAERTSRHARRWLENHDPVFHTTGASLRFAELIDRDAGGAVDLADAVPGDRVRVTGKLALRKRRCATGRSLLIRRIKISATAREAARSTDPARDKDHRGKPAPESPAPESPAPESPPPPPPPPIGGVIWAGDAESELALEWATGNAFDVNSGKATSTLTTAWYGSARVQRVTSPVAQGTYAYAMTVLASDRDAYTSGAQRTELGQNNAARTMADGVDRQMHQGEERWIALQMRIPSSYPGAAWNTLVQLKGAGSGNGPLGLYWENNRVVLKKSASQTYGSTNIGTVWSPSVATPRDRWIKLLVHVKWSTEGDGFYELFGDLGDEQGFRQLKPLTGGWTLKHASDGTPVSVGARFGIYRAALAEDTTAYFDGFAVAATSADAILRAFGPTY